MAKKAQDLFAPPTEDELQDDLFAPPTEDELAQSDVPMITGEGLLKGSLQALPLAGSLAGGVLGTGLGPLGTIGGAGLGAALGRSAEQAISELFFNEGPDTYGQLASELAQEGAYGALGETAGLSIPVVAQGIKTGLKKTASSLSGVPEKVMETYATRGSEFKNLPIEDLQQAADEIRQGAQKSVSSFKTAQNTKISDALEKHSRDVVDMTSVINALKENQKKMNIKLQADDIKRIDDVIARIEDVGIYDKNGKFLMLAPDAFDTKQTLQGLAEYLPPGSAFKKKDFVDLTMARAASRANSVISKLSPEIRSANEQLAKVRRMDKSMTNKNLITPERPYSGLITAGSGQNQAAAQQLTKFDDITGANILKQAEDLAVARTFNQAPILPESMTGARLVPFAAGSAVGGFGIPDIMEGDYEKGFGKMALGIGAGAMGSPLGVRTGIDIARGISKISPRSTGAVIRQIPKMLAQQPVERSIESFPISQTQQLSSPQEAQMFEADIKNNSMLTPTQKASRLNLIRKHGRIYLGQ